MHDQYAFIKELKTKTRRNIPELLVLDDGNDPFYAGRDNRRKAAEWFATLWHDLRFPVGTHVRRAHYRIISQENSILWLDGTPYLNTIPWFHKLILCARDARYFGLVPMEDFSDKRNGETVIRQSNERASPADLYIDGGELDLSMPSPPQLYFTSPTIPQQYHIEIIMEKSTVNDIIEPIANRYRLNYTPCVGEISLTRCGEIIQRAIASGRPVRVLYVSDFDPAGHVSMPVACARKLEFLIRSKNLDIDLQLRPVVLTPEQCQEYELPRIPLNKTEQRDGPTGYSYRAAAFEARFGEGATELDALEALHPGELENILVGEIERYYDTGLDEQIEDAGSEIDGEVDGVNDSVLAEHEEEHKALQAEVDALNEKIRAYHAKVKSDLTDQAPYIAEAEWPEPADGDEDPDPLYDSKRDYLTQIDRYKHHQGKTPKPKRPRGSPKLAEAA